MLSNFELEKIAKSLDVKLDGIYMKNELLFKRTIGNYIINLDDTGNEGTHWTTLIVTEKLSYYFDSYGCPPPEQIIAFCKSPNSHLYFNTRVIQDLESELCGFYCMAFIKYVNNCKDILKKANDFSNMFDDSESELNGFLLKGFLNNKGLSLKMKKYLFKHK
jgi:hypothetical protein